MAENARFGTPFWPQKYPRKSLCGSLFGVLSQEMRHSVPQSPEKDRRWRQDWGSSKEIWSSDPGLLDGFKLARKSRAKKQRIAPKIPSFFLLETNTRRRGTHTWRMRALKSLCWGPLRFLLGVSLLCFCPPLIGLGGFTPPESGFGFLYCSVRCSRIWAQIPYIVASWCCSLEIMHILITMRGFLIFYL